MTYIAVHNLRPRHQEIQALLDLSARIGQDPLLIQGNNGNTSIKLDGTLWIKGSGKWLVNAKREESLVPVDLATARKSVRHNVDITQMQIVGPRLRPSVETAMHCVLRDRIVVHVHSVNTIAWAIRCDGRRLLEDRLAGLRWQWVPYVPSGIPLARQIEKVLNYSPDSNVFVLGNHGLVVCGTDCESVESLLAEVERRVSVAPRNVPRLDPALVTLAAPSSGWRLPSTRSLHTLGTDPISTRVLNAGTLFPWQANCGGSKIRALPRSSPQSRFAECANSHEVAPKFAVIEGSGTLVHNDITSAEEAMLAGLAQVLVRTEESAPVRYLTSRELMGLSDEGPYPCPVAMDSSPDISPRASPGTSEDAMHAQAGGRS